MDYTIIDAHAHLWLRQDTVVDGFPIRTLENGRSLFMGEIRQMVPPFMIVRKFFCPIWIMPKSRLRLLHKNL